MPRRGVYFLARVAKSDNVDQTMLRSAMLSPVPIVRYGSAWSLIDVKDHNSQEGGFLSGRLVKYIPEGTVATVDPIRKTEIVQPEPNLTVARSPFVYIPAHSGLAFLRVSSGIPEWNFADRFARVLEASLGGILVTCEVNLISDLKSFSVKLGELQSIHGIAASVFPPNPLFGPLWKSLLKYIKSRNANLMSIKEDSKPTDSLKTDLAEIVDLMVNSDEMPPQLQDRDVKIGDAAMLMAIDGYGKGKVKGRNSQGEYAVIRTTDSRVTFTFDSAPDYQALFEHSLRLFEELKRERFMEHEG